MRTPTSRREAATSIDPIVASGCDSSSEAGFRQKQIATAAYYKAEARGFLHGMELQDWLEAEADYDTARRNQP